MKMKKINKNDNFPTNTSTLPRRFHLTRDKASAKRKKINKRQRAPLCRILRRNPAEPSAPRHAPAQAHSAAAGEVPAGLVSDADRAERFGEKQGKGEAGGRETSPSRSRKPKPTKELESGKPQLQTPHPKVPGLGPGRPSQPPPAPSSSRQRRGPTPHRRPRPVPLSPSRYSGRPRPEASACCRWARGRRPRPGGRGAGLPYLHFPPPCRVLPVMGRHLAC